MTTDQGQDPTFSQQGQGQTGGTQGQPQGQLQNATEQPSGHRKGAGHANRQTYNVLTGQ